MWAKRDFNFLQGERETLYSPNLKVVFTPRDEFWISENMHFLVTFRYLQITFAVKSSGVDQVLTKILQIDQKLTFNIFHILK